MKGKIKNINYSKPFLKSLKKLPKEIIEKAKEKEKIFRKDPFDPRLKTHKLSGKEKEIWAFWIDYHYRIKLVFLDNNEVLFLEVGTHKIYK
ncbi:MAG TPA: type II toxin-antitoxin system mRNA interferase toxin, RelE/StbE family [Candidatus Portnoybacteria bacterium]|nr:type II toxin-antitoxin system mRNA interferase toxin, RelE/StbE family [Candidatus Portnoybacteria bacterium]